MKKLLCCLLLCALVLTGCSSKDSDETKKSDDSTANKINTESIENTTDQKNDTENSSRTSNPEGSVQKKYSVDDETITLDPVETKEGEEDKTQDQPSDTASTDPVSNISSEVKDYILNGQENKSEAEKIKWSASFLNQLDTDSLYNDYIAAGGNALDVDEFAKFITLNAPIPSNWQELFTADLKNAYGVEPSKIEYLEGDLYQAYIINEGSEVTYVTVSARTGYFHG